MHSFKRNIRVCYVRIPCYLPLMIDLRRLRAFSAWMQTGSVSMAAERLGLSQPAVTRLLHDLAESLKMGLFVREGRRIVPTSDALALYNEVDMILTGMTRIDEMAKGLRDDQHRKLQIACTPGAAFGLMPAALKTFVAEFPDVEISMEMSIPGDQRDWSGLGNFDLALSLMPLVYPDAAIKLLARVEAIAAMPSTHPLAKKQIITRDDLNDQRIILPTRNTPVYAQWQAALRIDKPAHVKNFYTTSAVSACQWAEAGIGVAVIDMFNGVTYGDRLQFRPLRPALMVEYVAMIPKNRKQSVVVDQFMEHLHGAVRTLQDGWDYS